MFWIFTPQKNPLCSEILRTIIMAELTGLEPATFRVTGGRSNQLSYRSKRLWSIYKLGAAINGAGYWI